MPLASYREPVIETVNRQESHLSRQLVKVANAPDAAVAFAGGAAVGGVSAGSWVNWNEQSLRSRYSRQPPLPPIN